MSDVNRPQEDSVEKAVALVGDRWTFLILREAFFGERRFDGFLEATGASRNVLSNRLKRLVAHGLLEKVRYSSHSNRHDYKLTEKGLDLYPLIVQLMRWGDRWLSGGKGPPLVLRHAECGTEINTAITCDRCNTALTARDISWEPGGDEQG